MKTKHDFPTRTVLTVAYGFRQPAITTQPANQSVRPGANVQFRLSATIFGSMFEDFRKIGARIGSGRRRAGVGIKRGLMEMHLKKNWHRFRPGKWDRDRKRRVHAEDEVYCLAEEN